MSNQNSIGDVESCRDVLLDTKLINMHENPKVSDEGHGHPLQGVAKVKAKPSRSLSLNLVVLKISASVCTIEIDVRCVRCPRKRIAWLLFYIPQTTKPSTQHRTCRNHCNQYIPSCNSCAYTAETSVISVVLSLNKAYILKQHTVFSFPVRQKSL